MEETKHKLHLKMNIQFHQPVTAYALLSDGWLPFCFAPASIVLVDRNIVATAKSIAAESKRADIAANKWWFNFFNNQNYTLNPILAALEGRNRQPPTYDEFVLEFQDASEALGEVFPNARLMDFEEQHYRAGYAISKDLKARYDSDTQFLLCASKHLLTALPEKKLGEVEEALFSLSKRLSPKPSPFVILAAVSCLYEDPKNPELNIGRNIIKPKENYSESSAHNAISDLRSLELLLCFQQLQGPSPIFCTRDRALLNFWLAILHTRVARSEDGLELTLRFNNSLFPRLKEEEYIALIDRLSRDGL
ncbi:hypothetical protein Q666_12075 [Marinobacter sp. ES-1]|uniref:hypothetical protein n=1 Tax=Marinobacter sp. ES-1 TaxID=1396858 RepID=UPI0003B81767|nr:hypothetical protein [Marinobacter sp. ES-1]ERP91235.1 hypothetical protein Q666_12075 [Marinobacter sp. ES-1]